MKSGVLVIVLLFVGFVYCQSSPCDAIPIVIETGGNATEYGNNNNMPRFAPSLCNRGASGTVWYSIQPEAGQNVLITTCGSYTQFDTILGVYSGSCDNLVCEEFSVLHPMMNIGMTMMNITIDLLSVSHQLVKLFIFLLVVIIHKHLEILN